MFYRWVTKTLSKRQRMLLFKISYKTARGHRNNCVYGYCCGESQTASSLFKRGLIEYNGDATEHGMKVADAMSEESW